MKGLAIIAVIGIIAVAGIAVYAYSHNSGDTDEYWIIKADSEGYTDYTITQEMINCVGSSDPADIFANVEPNDANFIVFQYNSYGELTSWTNRYGGNTLTSIRPGVVLQIAMNPGEGPITIYIPKC